MRAVVAWPAPGPEGVAREESALVFDRGRDLRLLLVAPLFDEANKLRRQLVEIMRRLDLAGIDSMLPDLPGTHESLLPQGEVSLDLLRQSTRSASEHFRATHCFSARNAALFAPTNLPGWRYAPVAGRTGLRALLRARTIAAQESGRTETLGQLQEIGSARGIDAGGWRIGRELFNGLSEAEIPPSPGIVDIAHETVGGVPLWLRAEPDEDPAQADALAAILAVGMMAA